MSIIQPINDQDPSLNPVTASRVELPSMDSAQIQSKQALDALVSQLAVLDQNIGRSFLQEYTFGHNLNDDALALSIMLSMSDVSLGEISSDILVSLKVMFGISNSQIDIHLVGMMARFTHLGETGQLNSVQLADLKLALKQLETHSNQTLRNIASKFLKTGTNSMTAAVTSSAEQQPSLQAALTALQAKATEPLSEQVSPTIAAPLSSPGDASTAFGTPSSTSNVISSKDGSIRIDANDALAGMHVLLSGAAAHASATVDAKGKVHQVGVVELNGLHMVMSPLVAALVSSLVTKRLQENRKKVAIVCDSVVCLDGMDEVDSIYILDVSKDVSVQTFAHTYQDLIDRGYRRIMSIHVSPLLDKTYRIAKEAAEDVVDADVKVVNSHANGLGLGILVREIKEGIDNEFSPTEIGALIKRSILKMKHWWVPFAFNYHKNEAWLERTMDARARMKLKVLKFKPVITLQRDQLKLAEAFFDEESALRYVIKSVKAENEQRSRKLLHVGIEYRGQVAYRQALSLKNKLQVVCPRANVTLHTAGSVTVSRLGAELIGVCVI